MFRPFPVQRLCKALGHVKKVAVIDRNCSFGAGGIFAQELKAALCSLDHRPQIYSYIAGLGGRDVNMATIEEIYRKTRAAEAPEPESVWIGVKENG